MTRKAEDVLRVLFHSYNPRNQTVAISDAQKALYEDLLAIVGEDRPYKKYEPCPTCGGGYQYQCACDIAEAKVKAELRTKLKEYFSAPTE